MRFGGHETFPVRDGWLYKGLDLLRNTPERYSDRFVSDALGVGRNMAKSIWHWLRVTGLTESASRSHSSSPELTAAGQCVFEHDPYMMEIGTWWALHINLVTQNTDALAWPWFFNMFGLDRFDRTHCTSQLQRYLELNNLRQVSSKTLNKDILCLLNSYAKPVPKERGDPEDIHESPFRDLGLLTHFRDTGMYEVRREIKEIPPELMGYVLAKTFGEDQQPFLTVPFRDAMTLPGAPGRVFALNAENLLEVLETSRAQLGDQTLTLDSLAGERMIRVCNHPPEWWLAQYYQGVTQA